MTSGGVGQEVGESLFILELVHSAGVTLTAGQLVHHAVIITITYLYPSQVHITNKNSYW